MNAFVIVLIGVLGGIAGAIQSGALGVMEDRVGTLPSVFVTYGLGGLVIGIAMAIFGSSKFADLGELPLWTFSAGIMGLIVVGSLGLTIAEMGVGPGLTLFTAASLIAAALIDHFGWTGVTRELNLQAVAGFGLVVAGTWLVVAQN